MANYTPLKSSQIHNENMYIKFTQLSPTNSSFDKLIIVTGPLHIYIRKVSYAETSRFFVLFNLILLTFRKQFRRKIIVHQRRWENRKRTNQRSSEQQLTESSSFSRYICIYVCILGLTSRINLTNRYYSIIVPNTLKQR